MRADGKKGTGTNKQNTRTALQNQLGLPISDLVIPGDLRTESGKGRARGEKGPQESVMI